MSLKSEVYSLLNNASRLCRDCPEAGELLKTIDELRGRLESPLRVAVAGIMKAGKSTFMNALMGADILYTGELETTYTVGWFKYGESPSITVCFRDGTTLEAPFSDLGRWSVRAYEKENPRINDVKYLIIYYPSPVLKQLEFIDTPGLNSVYGTDAQNTMDFLALQGSEDTLYETSMADAVIYAFNRTVAGFDKDILDAFHSGGQSSSPINSLGILTKVDMGGVWDIFSGLTPVEAGKAVTDNVMKNPNVKGLLFSVFPVCAKVVEGYFGLKDEDWEALKLISKTPQEELEELLFDAATFADSTEPAYMALGTPKARRELIRQVGQYGILEIARQLREDKTREEIGEILQDKCGIRAVREILLSHFGNRTFLIKTRYIFNTIRSVIAQIRKNGASGRQMRGICEQLLENIDDLMSSVQTLKELKVLQLYYNGQLKFTDDREQEDFLRVTGEYGRSPEDRLGMPKGSTVAQLEGAAREKVALWHGKASGFMLSGTYVEAASTLARSYEQMYYHLNALVEE